MRPPRPQDVAEVRRVLRHNYAHLKPWNPAPRPGEDPTSITEVSNTLLRQRREWKNGRTFAFMLSPKDDPSRFIGKIALNGVMQLFRFLKIGLAVILCFIGAKMLIEPWFDLPTSRYRVSFGGSTQSSTGKKVCAWRLATASGSATGWSATF